MRVVVTGGAGFIGSNLVDALLDKGYDVTVIDNLSTGRFENIKEFVDQNKIKFIKGDVTDINLLEDVFRDTSYVFHQAAIPSVVRSVNNPSATNKVNVDGTLNVLIAARDCEVDKVVYASSSSVYGDTPELPKREDMKPNPLSPYAVSKLTGEYYCKVFREVYGIKTICLRYFNVYGPRQDPNGEYAAVIPRFITRILEGKPPIIYGDGFQTRDFTYVKDVIKANILAAENSVTGVFNIAGGKRITINELARRIMKLLNVKLEPIYEKPRAGDIKHSLADISLSKMKIGYHPEYDIDKGLEETIEWFKKQRNYQRDL